MVDQPRDPDAPPLAPDPASHAGPTSPAVPWQPSSPAGSQAAGMRPVEVIAWVIGVGAVFVLGRGLTLLDGSMTAFEVGRVVGSILGALLIGLVVRWVWVKLRKSGRVLSPWILLVATLVLLISLSRT